MSKNSILLVDDNPNDVTLTVHALKKNNLVGEIVVARDGVEALDYLFGTGQYEGRNVSELPAVVMLDLKLPKVDGLEVLKQIRADKRTRRLPVVILYLLQGGAGHGRGDTAWAPTATSASRWTSSEFMSTAGQLGLYWLLLNQLRPGGKLVDMHPKGTFEMDESLRVLIVEDSENDARLLINELQQGGDN